MKNIRLFLSEGKMHLDRNRLMCLLMCLFMVLLPMTALAQGKIKVSGIVTDNKGEAIIGASVHVSGTTMGTVTDLNGKFEFSAPAGADLMVSYIGYIAKMVKATGSPMKIVLSDDSKELGEAVVVGYGTVKRENLLGSVSSLSGQEIEDIPAGNLSQTLVGKLASVNISETTGRPGSTTPLTIRTSGSFSTGSDKPLFIINGVICDSQDEFDMLDPNQIESMSILKDAAAAVYGARAAGGAVIVTLKKGKEGKPKISYTGQAGFTNPTLFPKMLSAYDQGILMNEYSRVGGITSEVDYSLPTAYTQDELEAFKSLDYNWVDAVWKNSYQVRNNLNLSGGTDKVRYYVGGSLWNETGNFVNINVKKYSIRSSLEASITSELTAGLELSTSNNDKRYPYMQGDNEDNMNGMYGLLLYTPRWQPYKSGDLYVQTDNTKNPIALLESDCYKGSQNMSTDVLASLAYKPKFIPGLTASVRYSYTDGHTSEIQYTSPYTIWAFERYGTNSHLYNLAAPTTSSLRNTGDNERLMMDYGKSNSYQLNASLVYDRLFGKHHVSGMFNYEQSENKGSSVSLRKVDQQIPGLQVMDAYKTVDLASSTLANAGRLGFIGRLNYDYDGKYLFESSFREEASVKFASGNQWGFFPQAALGWRISEEPFFKDHVFFMDYLKLRASAGLLGQDNGLGNYEYLLSYGIADGQYFGTGTDAGMANGLTVNKNGLVTKGVTWEKTSTYNVGIDTKFLNNKLDFSIDAYFKHTWDIFDNASVTYTDIVGTSGSSIPKINSGIVNAWGTDIEAGYTGKISDDANYTIKGNFSWGDNKVIRRQQDVAYKGTYAWYEGHSTNVGEYGYKIDYSYSKTGIFQNQDQVDAYLSDHPGMTFWGETPAVGMLIFKDVARAGDKAKGETYYVNQKDGIVNEYDMVPLAKKSGTPFAYGFSLGASYKTLRMDVTFTGGWGGYTIMHKSERTGPYYDDTNNGMIVNALSYWKDSWTVNNQDAAYPSIVYKSLNQQPSEFWMRSASILRMNNINLSYSLPRNLPMIGAIPFTRLFMTCTNLLTLYSDFKYKDPNLARYYDYPLLRTVNIGLNLSL
ncbi:MAG: TonB-dependent receptor [Bacteroidota bacterium]|nr:TonB-dependent receptor [Bacteroidota bacterium]